MFGLMGAMRAQSAGSSFPPLEIAFSPAPPDGTTGIAYTLQAVASGGDGSFTYSKVAGPDWLTINPATGEGTGTPDEDGASVTVTVGVEDGQGSTQQVTDTIAVAWTPYVLYLAAEIGAWYDPSDLSTVFEDSAGTIPASVNGPVGRINDKSGNGLHATQGTSGAKPTLRQSGGLYYLEGDGVDDRMQVVSAQLGSAAGYSTAAGLFAASTVGIKSFVDADGATRMSQCLRTSAAAPQSIAFNTTPAAFTDGVAGSLTANVAAVLAQVTLPASVQLWLNNASNGSTAITGTMQSASQILTLMGHGASSSQRAAGGLYVAVHLNRPLTTPERESLQTYAASKSGVTL